MKRKHTLLLLIFAFVAAFLIACGDGEVEEAGTGNGNGNGSDTPDEVIDDNGEGDGEPDEVVYEEFSNEPVTLKVATPWGENYFMTRFGEYVEETLDHITIEHIDWNGSVEQLEEHYANNVIPDVFLSSTGQYPLEELDSDFGLDDMIEQYGVDLSHIQPMILDEMRSRDSEGRLVGMPQEVGNLALHYNKTVFDLFGVEYPDPDVSMSWEELFDLAGRLTGELNGVYYSGLHLAAMNSPLWELSSHMTDPETGEVLLMSDPNYAKFLDLLKSYDNIAGNEGTQEGFYDGSTAMLVLWHGFLHQTMGFEEVEDQIKAKESYDLAPIPSWSDNPGVGPSPRGVHAWAVNNHAENKEAAFQFVILGASEEYQLQLSRSGTPSVLGTPESFEQFGADHPLYQGKNLQALFATQPAEPEVKSRWDQFVTLDLAAFLESGMDTQEFLRIATEESQIAVDDAMARSE